jgi:putative thioredoxin
MATATTVRAPIFDVTTESFEREVIERSKEVPVVVDFWAAWCGPCRALGPVLEKLAREGAGSWLLAKLDVDSNQALSQAYRIQGIPAVKAFVGGKVVAEFTGAQPEKMIRGWLTQFVRDSGSDALAAIAALEAAQPDEAVAQYRLLLGSEPGNNAALFALGRLQALRGAAEGFAALRQLPADADNFVRAQALLPLAELTQLEAAEAETPSATLYAAAAAAVRAGDYAAAVDGLLRLVMVDRGYRDDGARRAIVALLAALGDGHALTVPTRRRLANALF